MEFTNEQIETIKAAALPIDYGSITIQIGADSHYLDIDVHRKLRIGKKPAGKNRNEPQKKNA
ncbi:MAG: hypothetical protein Pg6C_17920 [Treponemataceae bacterium]|nr:MAG: hypothetical protein Pg6C_17920 [Treponemataceae bacterium]